MSGRRLVHLGEVLTRAYDPLVLHPESEYLQVTARLWGQGLTERGRVRGAEISATSQNQIHLNQFLISKIDARNGAFGVVTQNLEGAVVSNDFPVFDVNPELALPHFIDWMSKSHWFVRLCKQVSEGSTNRVRLREDRFLELEISLPQIEDQREIVERLDDVSSRLNIRRKLSSQIDADLISTLRSVFEQAILDAPRRRMNDVAPLVRRPVEIDLEGAYPELGVRSFGRGTFHKPSLNGIDVGSKKLFTIQKGDLIFNIVFAWEGAVAVAKPEDEGRVGSHRFLTCVCDSLSVSPDFLNFYFQTPEGRQQLGEASPGGAGRNRTLGLKALEAIQVPVPALDAQQSFDELQAKVAEIRRTMLEANGEADALIPSMLNEMFGVE